MPAPAYSEAMAYIDGLATFGSHLGLTRITGLLKTLGHPERSLRIVHVAGTNGKGSVAVMISSILTAAGYRTGLFVKPCWEFRDQIRVDGVPIAENEAARLILDRVAPAAEGLSATGRPEDRLTQFEVVVPICFLYMAERKVDFLVLEAGLGGRLDATNALERSAASVITPVSLDHTDYLGPTLADIAAEKAGIIKRSSLVISAPQPAEVLGVIAAAARQRGADLVVAETCVTPKKASLTGQVFDYRPPGPLSSVAAASPRPFEDLTLPLLGPHQLENVATAITTVLALAAAGIAPAVGPAEVRRGLLATRWPGRFEVISGPAGAVAGWPASDQAARGPVGGPAARPTVIVDGAHNPAGARAFAASLSQLLPGRKVALVLGLLADKDVEGFLSLVLPPALGAVARVYTCSPPSPRAMDAEELGRRVRAKSPGLPVRVVPEVSAAVTRAMAEASPGEVVAVAGSLYQLGQAREAALRAEKGQPERG